jgi:hypothetical protein
MVDRQGSAITGGENGSKATAPRVTTLLSLHNLSLPQYTHVPKYKHSLLTLLQASGLAHRVHTSSPGSISGSPAHILFGPIQ